MAQSRQSLPTLQTSDNDTQRDWIWPEGKVTGEEHQHSSASLWTLEVTFTFLLRRRPPSPVRPAGEMMKNEMEQHSNLFVQPCTNIWTLLRTLLSTSRFLIHPLKCLNCSCGYSYEMFSLTPPSCSTWLPFRYLKREEKQPQNEHNGGSPGYNSEHSTHCADGAHTWRHAQTCTETRREQTRICSRARADTHTHMHTIFLPVSY